MSTWVSPETEPSWIIGSTQSKFSQRPAGRIVVIGSFIPSIMLRSSAPIQAAYFLAARRLRFADVAAPLGYTASG